MKIQIHSKNSIERLATKPFSENTALISIGDYGSKPTLCIQYLMPSAGGRLFISATNIWQTTAI